jgi:hypothetical protein
MNKQRGDLVVNFTIGVRRRCFLGCLAAASLGSGMSAWAGVVDGRPIRLVVQAGGNKID